VSVRQQQVERRRSELQQRLVRAHRVVPYVDRAQNAAIAVPELRRLQQVKAVSDRIETVPAIGVAPVPPGRFGVPVQADAYLDLKALQCGQHRAVEESSVGLEGDVHLGGHAGAKQADQAGQPVRPGQQRLTAVQYNVDAREAVLSRVPGNALDGFADHRRAH